MTEGKEVSHERDVSMRLFPYGTALRTQKMLAAEKILREEYPAYSELLKALEALREFVRGKHLDCPCDFTDGGLCPIEQADAALIAAGVKP